MTTTSTVHQTSYVFVSKLNAELFMLGCFAMELDGVLRIPLVQANLSFSLQQ